MSQPPVVLALDLGTSSVKALAVDAGGNVVASSSARYPTVRSASGAAEQEPRDWWAGTVAAITALGSVRQQVAALAVTGQMHGTVLLDAAGEVIAPAIIWEDQRGADDARTLNAAAGGALPASAGSVAASGFQAVTVHWLRRTRPALWARVAHVLLPKDALIHWLTGELASDPSDAAGAWLLDSQRQTWSRDLCDTAGVRIDQLPRLLPPGAVVGNVRKEIAARSGLPTGIPVVVGGGDAPCAALGAGIVDPSEALIMLSTGAQVIRPATQYTAPTGGLHVWPAALPDAGHWNRMGATLNAGVAIDWLKRVLSTGDIDRLAASATDRHPPLFLPWLTGERDPAIGATARAAFLGLTASHGPAELAWAVLEGIAGSLVTVFDHIRGNEGPPERVLVAGGGSRLPTLVRLIATALDQPLTPCPMPDLSALGAAMLGAHALGWISLPRDARVWRMTGQPIEPDATMREMVQTRLAIARALNAAIAPAMQRLDTLGTDCSTGGA